MVKHVNLAVYPRRVLSCKSAFIYMPCSTRLAFDAADTWHSKPRCALENDLFAPSPPHLTPCQSQQVAYRCHPVQQPEYVIIDAKQMFILPFHP